MVPFGLALLIFTFTFFIYRVFQLTEMVVNRGMMLSDVLKVFAFASPYFFMFTIPMSVLFAVVLTFLKLSSDNEIIALKAAGISLYRLLPPVYMLAAFGFPHDPADLHLPGPPGQYGHGRSDLRDDLLPGRHRGAGKDLHRRFRGHLSIYRIGGLQDRGAEKRLHLR